MCDDAHIELQALQATYEAALAVTSTAPVSVSVALAPRGWPLVLTDLSQGPAASDGEPSAEHEAQCFVRASLVLECGPEYPAQPPAMRLQQPKGAYHILRYSYNKAPLQCLQRHASDAFWPCQNGCETAAVAQLHSSMSTMLPSLSEVGLLIQNREVCGCAASRFCPGFGCNQPHYLVLHPDSR